MIPFDLFDGFFLFLLAGSHDDDVTHIHKKRRHLRIYMTFIGVG